MAIDDATKYQWLKSKLEFKLQSYNGPDYLPNATWSSWSLKTYGVFEGTNQEPASIDAAIEAAMAKELQEST